MSKLQIVFFTLSLFMITCTADFVSDILMKEDDSKVVEVTAKIVISCYGTRLNTIGLAGNSSDSLVASLSANGSFSVTLINDIDTLVDTGLASRLFHQKLHIFMVAVSSSTELHRILWIIKNSRWWNHMAPFYMLQWPRKKQGCSAAYDYLSIAWRMNLISAKFICIDVKKGPLIYTFNPYTNYAPAPWRLKTIYTGENNHSWALLMREYHGEICETIDFEKAYDLAGYELRATTYETKWGVTLRFNKTGIDSLDGLSGNMWRHIFLALNATVKLLIHPFADLEVFFDENGTLRGSISETNLGQSDVALIPGRMEGLLVKRKTYPHDNYNLYIMTQYGGHESQLSKFVSVLDVRTRIGLCIVFLITVIFFKHFVGQTAATTALNMIRMSSNMALEHLPSNSASRIYIGGLFLLVVTMQGIYQGNMAAIVTGKKSVKLVNTLIDLEKSHYTIYCWRAYCGLLDKRAFKGRTIPLMTFNCTEYVLRDSSAACLWSAEELIEDAARYTLHLSKEAMFKTYSTWPIRPDCPLDKRINTLMQRLVEAHIHQYMSKESKHVDLHTIDINNMEYNDQSFKVATLHQLGFAFAILGIGLGCATVCFLAEMVYGRRLKDTKKIRPQYRNLFSSFHSPRK